MSQPPYPPAGGPPQQPPGGWRPGQPPEWSSDPTQPVPSGQQYPPTQPMPSGQQYPPTQPTPVSQPTHSPIGSGYDPPAIMNSTGGAAQYGQPGQPAGNPQQGGPSGQPGSGPNPNQGGPSGQPPTSGPNPGHGVPSGQPGGTFGQPTQSGPGQAGPGPAGQFGQPQSGQFGQPNPGGGQYGPPGRPFGPPPGGNQYGPRRSGSGGRNPTPIIITVVAGAVVLGLLAWFLFLRPTTSAAPNPGPSPSVSGPTDPQTTSQPTATESPSTQPSQTSTSSPRPSGTTSAACADELSSVQCQWAVYLKKYVAINTCQPDSTDPEGRAFVCQVNARGKIPAEATVSMKWADSSSELTGFVDDFFKRAGVAKSKISKSSSNPPSMTDWFYTSKPKDFIGKLGLTPVEGGSRIAWTFAKQRFYVETDAKSVNAKTLYDWWKN